MSAALCRIPRPPPVLMGTLKRGVHKKTGSCKDWQIWQLKIHCNKAGKPEHAGFFAMDFDDALIRRQVPARDGTSA